MTPVIDATVIIAAWNAAETIDRAVQSALDQRDVAVEVVVADDCSTDETARIVSEWAGRDPRVRLVKAAKNGGPGAARNLGLDAARGTWVAVLDADDRMAPERLRGMIDLASKHHADVVLGNFCRVDGDDVPLGDGAFLEGGAFDRPQQWDLHAYVDGNKISPGEKSLGYLKPLIRREFLERCGIRYDETLRNGEDCHLIFECLLAGGAVWFDPAPHYRYTVQQGSVSYRINPDHITALLAADERLVSRHRAALPAETRRLFADRGRALRNLVTSEIALGALKRGQVGSFAKVLLANPMALGRTCRQLLEALGKRVG
ncbi:glycosyltransferase family 2 protein [Rhodobacteraceae bacterium NNCM2]|nr:glycosyltransferase family 2 protein [Coraliihabitans acroporae]